MGSLPYIHQISLSFRVPVPLPIQAFTRLIELATPLVTLNLSGLQLSTKEIPTKRSSSATTTKEKHHDNNNNGTSSDQEGPVEALIRAFQNHTNLKNIQLCRYRPVKSSSSPSRTTISNHNESDARDPLLQALCKVPQLNVFHLERTDIFTDATVLDLICRGPFPSLKIGTLERSIHLEHYLPFMGTSLAANTKLTELVVHHLLQDSALTALSQVLRHNPTIQKSALRIQSNEFGRISALTLQHNATLKSLELNVLGCDRSSFRKQTGLLAHALGANHRSALTTLKLDCKSVRSSNMLTDPFLKVLRHDNFVLQNLVINRNTVPLNGDVLFYLKLNQLRRNHFLRRDVDEEENARDGDNNNSGHELGLIAAAHNYTSSSAISNEAATTTTTTASNTAAAANTTSTQDFRTEWIQMLVQNKQDVRVTHYFLSVNPLILPRC